MNNMMNHCSQHGDVCLFSLFSFRDFGIVKIIVLADKTGTTIYFNYLCFHELRSRIFGNEQRNSRERQNPWLRLHLFKGYSLTADSWSGGGRSCVLCVGAPAGFQSLHQSPQRARDGVTSLPPDRALPSLDQRVNEASPLLRHHGDVSDSSTDKGAHS